MRATGRLVLVSAVLLAGCTSAGERATPSGAATSTPNVAVGCQSRIETGPLPDWADAGFSEDARVPHVFGARGEIVAVLFGHPLTHGGPEGRNNKILWVSRPATASPDPTAPASLMITATLDDDGTRVTREVPGGPGPSGIDLPQPGCWHLELRWSGRTDTMDLRYAAG